MEDELLPDPNGIENNDARQTVNILNRDIKMRAPEAVVLGVSGLLMVAQARCEDSLTAIVQAYQKHWTVTCDPFVAGGTRLKLEAVGGVDQFRKIADAARQAAAPETRPAAEQAGGKEEP